jgi:hypothetical protein
VPIQFDVWPPPLLLGYVPGIATTASESAGPPRKSEYFVKTLLSALVHFIYFDIDECRCCLMFAHIPYHDASGITIAPRFISFFARALTL